MIAEIITIGLEVTTGSILNTNSKYISNQLLDLGVEVYYHTSVDDNADRLRNVIGVALQRADLIITTGGLGPTADDLTKETMAEALGLDLSNDKEMEDNIRNIFKSRDRTMPPNNLKQASLPKGGKFLRNTLGTAPGILIKQDDKTIIMLPGPPQEMETMFNKEVIPLISKDFNIITKSVNLIGIGESELEFQIKDLLHPDSNLIIATFPKDQEIEIKIIGKGKNPEYINNNINKVIEILNERFSKYIFGYDNVKIESIIYEILKDKNYKIGFCESCTGGLISSSFASIPGISQVYDRSLITYSNIAKIEEAGVSPETLDTYGPVSEETALEMAKGLFEKAKLDIVVSITGYAGPGSGRNNYPLGTVFICIYSMDNNIVKRYNFTGDRDNILKKATKAAFWELRNYLLKL